MDPKLLVRAADVIAQRFRADPEASSDGIVSGTGRERLENLPFHAALKEVLVARGVLLHASVRPPLRSLTEDERTVVRSLVTEAVES